MKANKIFFLALSLSVGIMAHAQGTSPKTATPVTKDHSPNPNIERMRIVNEKAAAQKAAAPAPEVKNKPIVRNSGNAVKYTRPAADPKSSIYKKPAPAK
jgi:hypothetical protein